MSWSTPNCRGPMPEPVTSVRSPHTAPEPKLNCMSNTPFQELLQPFLADMSDIPRLRITGDCRAREMVGPPAFDQQLNGNRVGGLHGAEISFRHLPLLNIGPRGQR